MSLFKMATRCRQIVKSESVRFVKIELKKNFLNQTITWKCVWSRSKFSAATSYSVVCWFNLDPCGLESQKQNKCCGFYHIVSLLWENTKWKLK